MLLELTQAGKQLELLTDVLGMSHLRRFLVECPVSHSMENNLFPFLLLLWLLLARRSKMRGLATKLANVVVFTICIKAFVLTENLANRFLSFGITHQPFLSYPACGLPKERVQQYPTGKRTVIRSLLPGKLIVIQRP